MHWRIIIKKSCLMFLDTLTFLAFKLILRLNRQKIMEDAKRQMLGKALHSVLITLSGLKFSHNGLNPKISIRCVDSYWLTSNQRGKLCRISVLSMLQEFTICTLDLWTLSWIKCFLKISKPSIKKSLLFSKITPQSSKPSLCNPIQLLSGLKNFRIQLLRLTVKEL